MSKSPIEIFQIPELEAFAKAIVHDPTYPENERWLFCSLLLFLRGDCLLSSDQVEKLQFLLS